MTSICPVCGSPVSDGASCAACARPAGPVAASAKEIVFLDDVAAAPSPAPAEDVLVIADAPTPPGVVVLELASPAADTLVITEGSAAQPTPGFCPGCGNARSLGVRQCPRCGWAGHAPFHAAYPYGYGYEPPRPFSAAPLISALCVFFAMLAVHLVMGTAIVAGAPAVKSMLFAEAADALLVIVWAAFLRRDIGPMLVPAAAPGAGRGALWCLMGIAAGFVTFGIASTAMEFLTQALSLDRVLISDAFLKQGYGWGAVILAVVVQPAVIEELAFRGIIQSGLEKTARPATALACTAAMFAGIHLSPPSFPHLFILGAAAGWLRLRTGSLYPAMLLHFTHNFLCVLDEARRMGGG
jgi:membrane protease YdiL (CAAX protease family)